MRIKNSKVHSCLDKIRIEHNNITLLLYKNTIIHSCLDKIRIGTSCDDLIRAFTSKKDSFIIKIRCRE